MFGLAVMAGEPLSAPDLIAWTRASDCIFAADGGFDHLVKIGVQPDWVVGDLDSVSAQNLPTQSVLHDPDPDHSDADKVLAAFVSRVPQVALACIHGGRYDHLLASFHSALASRLRIRWVFPLEYGALIRAGERLDLNLKPGSRLSLMPLMPSVVSLTGVRWPLSSADLSLGQLVSLSNEVNGPVAAHIESGAAVLLVERGPCEVMTW